MAQRDDKKRLGKKHRQAATRPKKGRALKATPTTGAVDPRKRKVLSTKRAAADKASRVTKQSPEREKRRAIRTDGGGSAHVKTPKGTAPNAPRGAAAKAKQVRPADGIVGRQTPRSSNMDGREEDWRDIELLASQMVTETESVDARELPLIAVCGRPNVGKSTLFNRLTGSRRSIVGDEPGITRDRIYGEIEWMGREARIVDTGGVVPDDEALIPAEIFRQAKVGLEEADAIVMVVDGRTELASPDLELARLLLRGGKPVFLAVNKMDTEAMQVQAENFRRLGFRNVLAISAEHGSGMGDLLDAVFEVLPEPKEIVEEPEVMLTENDEAAEDEDGPDFSVAAGAMPVANDADVADSVDAEPKRARNLRSHGEYESRETKVAIIGRPNVGKSTLLNALTGKERAIVSPIAGTTRDAVDEVVERGGHNFRFVDTAGIRRKGKTKLMAEKLSVIMARKHLEAADVSLLIIDAGEGVAALDANIGGYAHESGRSVIIVVNKWDLMTRTGRDGMRLFDGKPPADQKTYEQDVRDKLKYLDYAPLLFISAADGKNIESVFKKVELVARERRKRVTTGQMNKFLEKVDFQKASVPMNKRVRIYYMTQAAVAPPTFVLFTDKDIKMHFSFERFLGNQIRENFGFIGSPIWFKIKARNKKKTE